MNAAEKDRLLQSGNGSEVPTEARVEYAVLHRRWDGTTGVIGPFAVFDDALAERNRGALRNDPTTRGSYRLVERTISAWKDVPE